METVIFEVVIKHLKKFILWKRGWVTIVPPHHHLISLLGTKTFCHNPFKGTVWCLSNGRGFGLRSTLADFFIKYKCDPEEKMLYKPSIEE